MTSPAPRLTYQSGLDGLRAVAVTLVIAAHMAVYHAEGGILGVHMFFVLSGFLITTLLLQEHEDNGRIGLLAFYARRGLRLFPALVAVVVATDIYLAFDTGNPVRSVTIRSSVPALFYVANWEWVIHGVGSLGWFGHMWSLAVEEQFYLLWPLALILARHRHWSTIKAARVLTLACLTSLVLRVLAAPHVGKAGFFATPMVAELLLYGALAAVLMRSPRTRGHLVTVARRGRYPAIAYLVAYVLLTGTSVLSDPWLANGPALSLVGIATAILIVLIVSRPDDLITRALSTRPLVYLGQISYGMYLWHILVCFALSEQIGFGAGQHRYYWVSGYLLTVFVASGSKRFVEAPAVRLKARFQPMVHSPDQEATHPAHQVGS